MISHDCSATSLFSDGNRYWYSTTPTAEIEELGTITTGQVTTSNLRRFFTNGWP